MRLFRLFRNTKLRGLLIGLMCALACWVMNSSKIIRNLENWALDFCYVFREERTSQTEIVIIAIDDETLDWLHKPMMFMTPELASVIEHVTDNGASAVGVDHMIFDSDHDYDELGKTKTGNAWTLGDLRDEKEPARPIVLPELFIAGKDARILFPLRQWQSTELGETVDFLDSLGQTDAGQTMMRVQKPWHSMGFVNVFPDDDMAVRRQVLRFDLTNQEQADDSNRAQVQSEASTTEIAAEFEPSFAYAIYGTANDLDADSLVDLALANPASDDSFERDRIPVDRAGNLLINYRGPPGSFAQVSFKDVCVDAAGDKPDDFWNDKIVLIGETNASSPDRFATPFSNNSLTRMLWSDRKPEMMPGVEVHANVVATIGDRQFITTPWLLRTPVLLLLTGAVLGVILMKVNLEYGLLITFVHHWMWKLTCVLAFSYLNWRLEMISVLLLGVVLFGLIFALRWRWIRHMMGMVKSEEIAKALEDDPSSLDLKGEDRELTILFSDIRNFTNYSESHTPHEVVKMLNSYFAVVIPVIEKHGGVVNQYMGDGVMVLFGAPRRTKNHALCAMRSALEMIQQVHEKQDLWAKLDAPELRIGVGIHTGHCVVGTVGSPKRLDYTAIGDTTNTSARIEAGNKELGTEILVSKATIESLGEDVIEFETLLSDVKSLKVKGKKDSLDVYELCQTEALAGKAADSV